MSQEIMEWQIRVHGRVQGVGFRAAVLKYARTHNIAGFVRNCLDGSVEILAQAKADQLEAFLASIRHRPGLGSIDHFHIDRRTPGSIYSSFEVRS